jgi:deazaflavin-dependent oxidoreductase (nitroreductase family)
MLFVNHGEGYAVVASNAASRRPPAWWLNLQAQPDCEAFVRGRWQQLRGREATAQESAALWPHFDAVYVGFEHYRAIATRQLPVVILDLR